MSDTVGDFFGGMAEAAGKAAEGDLAGAADTASETASEAAGDVADGVADVLDADGDGDVDTDDAPLEGSWSYKLGKDPYYAELRASVDLDPTDGDVGAIVDFSGYTPEDKITLAHADGEADVDASDGEVGGSGNYQYIDRVHDADGKVDVDASDGEVGASGNYEGPGGRSQAGVTLPTSATAESREAESGTTARSEPARLADEGEESGRDLQDEGETDDDASRADFEARPDVKPAKTSADEPVTATVEKPERRPEHLDEAVGRRPQVPPDDLADEEAARLGDVNQTLAEELQEAARGPLVEQEPIERAERRVESELDEFIEVQKESIDDNKEMVEQLDDRAIDGVDDLARRGSRVGGETAGEVQEGAEDVADAAADARTRAGDLAEDFGDIGADLHAAGQKAARDVDEFRENAEGGGISSDSGAIDVSLTPSPAGPIPIPYPNLGEAAEDAADVAAIAEDLADAGDQAAADTADATGIADFDVTDPFGSGAGTEAHPLLNDEYGAGAGKVDIPGPLDSDDFGGGVDQDGDGDADLDDLNDIIGDSQEDVEEDVEEIVEDVVDAADSNDDGNVDEEDVEDAIENATGVEVDLNPFD